MGRTAGRLLLERSEGRNSAVRFSVTPSLIHRRSTAPPDDRLPGSAPLERVPPEYDEKGPPAGAAR
ncbi:hypothetical protein [Actinomadura sp. 3N407]|uniref:hypothetical protein n=1 Tax=Actinomadura sp. 3N407 TaxID=3457423 RepID=UPI003FCD7831